MKHIEVIDEQGVHLQNTYERRARGLVKKGRAYYVTASCICLFTPPENMEEKTLETNICRRHFRQLRKYRMI